MQVTKITKSDFIPFSLWGRKTIPAEKCSFPLQRFSRLSALPNSNSHTATSYAFLKHTITSFVHFVSDDRYDAAKALYGEENVLAVISETTYNNLLTLGFLKEVKDNVY